MTKSSSVFVCSNCGNESTKWFGKCPECGEWNTMQEFKQEAAFKGISKSSKEELELKSLGDVSKEPLKRISTSISEFDRVLGGPSAGSGSQGLVPGSVILISGDPGIGKSTLMLQLALNLASAGPAFAPPPSDVLDKSAGARRGSPSARHPQDRKGLNVVYASGEESESQISHRALRIANPKALENQNIKIVSSTNIDQIFHAISRQKVDLLIIDSVQTVGSDDATGFPGSLPQIRYVGMKVSNYAKKNNIPVFMVGHVTKEGVVAGPQMLSHMVDVVLYLEGESLTGTRIIRSFKNRYGDTSEVGIFVMDEKGLSEITEAESFFIDTKKSAIGSSVTVVQEGSRPLLVEIQALAIKSKLSFPRRVATGISEKRLEMLLAVLQKHGRLNTYDYDIFVNVVGGLKIQETASDLAVVASIASSMKAKPLLKTAAIGEVGLLGEVKSVLLLDRRIKEAEKFGFKNIFSVKNTGSILDLVKKI